MGLSERAQELSAFITPFGLYQCKVMPFGMRNSAATFQRLMNLILHDIPGCSVYIDDVVVYSDSWEEHLKILKNVFKALEGAGLVVNLCKSEIGRATVVYLGHEIGYGRVAPKQRNIEAIIVFPRPKNKKDVRSFLGLIGYYRRFIKNFSDLANPLTNLLKKGSKFTWCEECNDSFSKLKTVITSYPILRSPDYSKPFKLAVDASDIGVGSVLLQEVQGSDLPIAYFSKKLNQAQRKYSTVEKETLSLILAYIHFEPYLSSSKVPIIIYTDHNPLKFLNTFRNKNARLTRWSLMLQEKNLEIHHIHGKDNVVPDVLSRGHEV